MEDFAGVGKSVEKVLEVFARATGILYEPTNIRRKAEAEVYKIGLLADAEAKKNKVMIQSEVEGKLIAEKAKESLSERAEQRKLHKEKLKQSNIENVIRYAVLTPPSKIPDESVDPEWLNAFVDKAETVSSEVMQKLWAKVFVKEIEEPGRFSLKSLEFLKKLTRYEAEIFSKFCRYVTPQPDNGGFLVIAGVNKVGGFSTLLSVYEDQIFPKESEVDLTEWMILQNLGLVHADGLLWKSLPKGAEIDLKEIKFVTKKNKVSIHFYCLTPLGNELAKLVDSPLDHNYISLLKKKYSNLVSIDCCG